MIGIEETRVPEMCARVGQPQPYVVVSSAWLTPSCMWGASLAARLAVAPRCVAANESRCSSTP